MPISSRMLIPVPSEDEFFDQLSPATLLRWSRLDKEAQLSVKSYIRRTFKIDKLLVPFFTSEEYAAFRALQEETGTLISGSVALHFLDRTPLSVYTDLDLYVDLRYCDRIGDWLGDIGYQFQPREHEDATTFHELLQAMHAHNDWDHWADEEDNGPWSWFGNAAIQMTEDYTDGDEIARVFNFYKHGRKIQIIACYNSPLKVIINFHSTCVMNFISHEKAYSLYPWPTFEKRWSLVQPRERYNDHSVLVKYARRGWKMLPRIPFDEPRGFAIAKRRLVGDRTCWTLPLSSLNDTVEATDLNASTPPRPALSLVEANSWMLLHLPSTGNRFYATFSGFDFSSRNLKFRYVVADETMLTFLVKAWKSNRGQGGQGEVAYKDEKFTAMVLRRFAKPASAKKKRRVKMSQRD